LSATLALADPQKNGSYGCSECGRRWKLPVFNIKSKAARLLNMAVGRGRFALNLLVATALFVAGLAAVAPAPQATSASGPARLE
jgi:hypothetical protein